MFLEHVTKIFPVDVDVDVVVVAAGDFNLLQALPLNFPRDLLVLPRTWAPVRDIPLWVIVPGRW